MFAKTVCVWTYGHDFKILKSVPEYSWRHETGTYICFVQLPDERKSIQNNRQGNGLNHIAFMGKDRTHLASLVEELAIFANGRTSQWTTVERDRLFPVQLVSKF